MPEVPVVHYNEPGPTGKTRCGRILGRVKAHTRDKADVTCNSCIRLIKKDDQFKAF